MDDARLRQLRDAGTIILWYSCSIVANAASKLVLTHGFRHPPTLAISQFALACACVFARESHARACGVHVASGSAFQSLFFKMTTPTQF